MKDFITGLQFLTRLKLVKQTSWSEESFARSVKYFPLIGAIIGLVLASIYYIGKYFLPIHLFAVVLVVAEFIITGGLHCDGYMDTADGVFSGRSRERMLEIMKDSRVGANGVVAFVCLMFIKWSLYMDLSPKLIMLTLIAMPIVGRMGIVMAITLFPYARPEGIGKMFTQHAHKTTLMIAAVLTALLIIPMGLTIISGAVLSLLFAYLFTRWISNKLGGVTGDVYGATNEVTELFFLLVVTLKTNY